MGILKEFRDFAMRGNVVDLAVGVVIGGAFGKIVGAAVELIMAPIGAFMKVNFADWAIPMSTEAAGTSSLSALKEKGIPALPIGNFLQTTIDFLIVAAAVFMMVKLLNSMKKKAEAGPPPAPPEDVLLLREIRDSLRK